MPSAVDGGIPEHAGGEVRLDVHVWLSLQRTCENHVLDIPEEHVHVIFKRDDEIDDIGETSMFCSPKLTQCCGMAIVVEHVKYG